MMAQTVQERPEEEPVDVSEGDPRFVSEEQHDNILIRIYQEDIQTYKQMKKEEEKQELTSRRRRWFNKQIEDLREKIKEIKGDNSE